jgi:hypothetical protein
MIDSASFELIGSIQPPHQPILRVSLLRYIVIDLAAEGVTLASFSSGVTMLVNYFSLAMKIAIHANCLSVLSFVEKMVSVTGVFGSLVFAVAGLRVNCAFLLDSTRVESVNFQLFT